MQVRQKCWLAHSATYDRNFQFAAVNYDKSKKFHTKKSSGALHGGGRNQAYIALSEWRLNVLTISRDGQFNEMSLIEA